MGKVWRMGSDRLEFLKRYQARLKPPSPRYRRGYWMCIEPADTESTSSQYVLNDAINRRCSQYVVGKSLAAFGNQHQGNRNEL